jgi:hypothetical protein
MSAILPVASRHASALVVTPQWTVAKSTPSAACLSIASNISSGVIWTMLPCFSWDSIAAWYMGTAPTGTVDSLMTFRLTASMSPPVERSITVSAPASTAAASFASSKSRSARSADVPMLAFTLVRKPRPIAHGRASSLMPFKGNTAVPSRTLRAIASASSGSPAAACSSAGGMSPRFNLSMRVKLPPVCLSRKPPARLPWPLSCLARS